MFHWGIRQASILHSNQPCSQGHRARYSLSRNDKGAKLSELGSRGHLMWQLLTWSRRLLGSSQAPPIVAGLNFWLEVAMLSTRTRASLPTSYFHQRDWLWAPQTSWPVPDQLAAPMSSSWSSLDWLATSKPSGGNPSSLPSTSTAPRKFICRLPTQCRLTSRADQLSVPRHD